MTQKHFLIVFFSTLTISNMHTMHVAIPLAKTVAVSSIAQHIISSKRVEKELIGVLQKLNLVSASADLEDIRGKIVLHLVKQATQKSLVFLANQGLLKLEQIAEFNAQFTACWEKNYPKTSISETDSQRAISYISLLLPCAQNIANIYDLVTHIIAYQKEQDKKFRESLERDPRAKQIYQAAITQAAIELVTFCCNAHSFQGRVVYLRALYRFNSLQGRFGHKIRKAIDALNNICRMTNNKFKKQVAVHEIEEVTLEFFKEISDTPEQYISYLEQVREYIPKRAQEYIEKEAKESCFYEYKNRLCKKLSSKWLTVWSRRTDDQIAARDPRTLAQDLPAALVANAIKSARSAAGSADSPDYIGNQAEPLVYSVSQSDRLLYREKNVKTNITDKPELYRQSTSGPELHNRHEKPIALPPAHHPLELPELALVTPAQYDQLMSDYIAKLTDDEIIGAYQRERFRTHPAFIARLKSVIKNSSLKRALNLVKTLNNNDLVTYYNLLSQKLACTEHKKLEDRLLKLAQNTKQLKSLSYAQQQEVLENAGNIRQEQQIAECCKQLVKKQSSHERNRILLKYAKSAISNLNLRTKIEEAVPTFMAEVAKIMQEKIAQFTGNSEHEILACAFEAQEIALSNFTLLNSLTGDLRTKFTQLQEQARAIAAQYGFNFDTTAQIIQRFNIPASAIIAKNQQAHCLDMQNNLLATLSQLSRAQIPAHADMLYTTTVEKLAKLAVHAIKENNYGRAASIVHILEKAADFFSGAGQEVMDSATYLATNLAVQARIASIAEFSAVATTRIACAPMALGMLTFNLMSNNREAQDLCSNLVKAYAIGDFEAIGKLTVKGLTLSFDLRCAFNAVRNMAHNAYKFGNIKSFTQDFNTGLAKEQLVQLQKQSSVELHTQFTKTETHTKLFEEALKLGTSQQAWQKRVWDLCFACTTHKEVEDSLRKLNELSVFQRTFTPTGFTKPVKFDLDHIFVPRLTPNNIAGYHSTAICNASNKLKINNLETAPNGIMRGIVESCGILKEKTFFPASWKPEDIIEKVVNTLKGFDFANQTAGGNGRIKIKSKTKEGIDFTIVINPQDAIILSIYPNHTDWMPGELEKKLYGK